MPEIWKRALIEHGLFIEGFRAIVSDQAALHGLPGSIRNPRLLLLSVRRVEDQKQKSNYFRRGKMKSARLTILLCVLVSTLAAVFVLAATDPPRGISADKSSAQWKVVIPKTLFADKMRMAAFSDEKFGIMGGAGDPGKAHYTSDSGKTWTTAESSGG
jgi:hypothetical protein